MKSIGEMASELIAAGVRRLHVLAWRDLDDDDAGGSEVHADEFMTRFAAAGLHIVHRTSAAVGQPSEAFRHGYAVVRRGSRYGVFPRTAVAELTGRMGPSDALIEIWNGVPWFSPAWYRGRPRLTILHHVHGPMWNQVLPGPLGPAGRLLESTVAPPFYRRTATVTPSESTRQDLLALGFRPDRVTAVPNGVHEFFRPADRATSAGTDDTGTKAPVPTVVVVGRYAPVKRFRLALDAAETARRTVPNLRVNLIGDGPERPALEEWVRRHHAGEWVSIAGRAERHQLRDAYRLAWVIVSASLAEGWGLTLTEAAACGTPAVATDIPGHRCSVVDGVTGLLAPPDLLGATLAAVLGDHDRRQRLGEAALTRARTLTWTASATGVMAVLHGEVMAARRARPER